MTGSDSKRIKEIEESIKTYASRLSDPAVSSAPRVKKRILQKLGKLKKDLQQANGNTSSNEQITEKGNEVEDDVDVDVKKKNLPVQVNLNEDADDNDEEDKEPDQPTKKRKINRKETKTQLHYLNQQLSEFAISRQLKRAKQAVKQFMNKGFTLDVHAYSNLLNVYARCNNIEKSEEVLQEMISNHIHPNLVTYTILLKVYCENGMVNKAMEFFMDTMVKRKCFNLRSINTILRGCLRVGFHRSSFQLYKFTQEHQLLNSIDDNDSDDEDTPNQVVNNKSKDNNSQSAAAAFTESSMYESFVSLSCRTLQFSQAIQIVHDYITSHTNNKNSNTILENAALYVTLARTAALLGLNEEALRYVKLTQTLFQETQFQQLAERMKVHLHDTNGVTDSVIGNKRKLDDTRQTSLTLFQQHRRQQLITESEDIEEYITMAQNSFDAITTTNSTTTTGSNNRNTSLYNLVKMMYISCKIYIKLVSQVFYFGFDGDCDLETHGTDATNLDNTLDKRLEIALQNKFGLSQAHPDITFQQYVEQLQLNNNNRKINLDINTIKKDTYFNSFQEIDALLQQVPDKLYHAIHFRQLKQFGTLKNNKPSQHLESHFFNFHALFNSHLYQNIHYNQNDETEKEKVVKVQELQRAWQEDDVEIKLELCSGDGDWVVAQAQSERDQYITNSLSNNNNNNNNKKKSVWVAVELRYDRVQNILSKWLLSYRNQLIQQELNNNSNNNNNPPASNTNKPNLYDPLLNLAVLSGDASKIVTQHIASQQITAIFINYPQPPERITGGKINKSQGKHLLTNDFLIELHRVLKDSGTLTILSDNLLYIQSLAQALVSISVSSNMKKAFIDSDLNNNTSTTVSANAYTSVTTLANKQNNSNVDESGRMIQEVYEIPVTNTTNTTSNTTSNTNTSSQITSDNKANNQDDENTDDYDSDAQQSSDDDDDDNNASTHKGNKNQKKGKNNKKNLKPKSAKDSTPAKVKVFSTSKFKVTVYRGEPGEEAGHVVNTASYFDKLWQRGQKKRRWFLFVKKVTSINDTENI